MSYPPEHPLNPVAYLMWRYKRCPKCGAMIKREYKFCPECGTQLESEKKIEESERDVAIVGLLSLIIGFPVCMILFSFHPGALLLSLLLSIPVGFILLLIICIIYGILFSKRGSRK